VLLAAVAVAQMIGNRANERLDRRGVVRLAGDLLVEGRLPELLAVSRRRHRHQRTPPVAGVAPSGRRNARSVNFELGSRSRSIWIASNPARAARIAVEAALKT